MCARRWLGVGFALAVFAAMAAPARGERPPGYLSIGLGAFDVFDGDALAGAGYGSYRYGDRFFPEILGPWFGGMGPMVGISGNSDHSVAGYGALFLDIRPSSRWVVWPSGGLAGYRQGRGRDLGGTFVFHLEAYVGYHLAERHMLGVSFQHLSNAGINPVNPGTDSLFLSYTIAFP